MKLSRVAVVSSLYLSFCGCSVEGLSPVRPPQRKILAMSSRHSSSISPREHANRKVQSSMQSSQEALGTQATLNDALSPVEAWCVIRMEQWYRKALAIKCPFFRRRAADLLDAMDQVMRFLMIRHKSLDLLGPPPGWRCEGETCLKNKHLSIQETEQIIRNDWREDTNKGYYITGRLNTTIYRDDCLFDGPDPDMPVRGLRKYLNAASQLFDQGKSRSELLSLEIQDDLIVAKWRMNGILRLPWRPWIPEVTGTTTYHRDEDGLIYLHEETRDTSVVETFIKTFWPKIAERIWKEQEEMAEDEGTCVIS